jgi:hypothetical protein
LRASTWATHDEVRVPFGTANCRWPISWTGELAPIPVSCQWRSTVAADPVSPEETRNNRLLLTRETLRCARHRCGIGRSTICCVRSAAKLLSSLTMFSNDAAKPTLASPRGCLHGVTAISAIPGADATVRASAMHSAALADPQSQPPDAGATIVAHPSRLAALRRNAVLGAGTVREPPRLHVPAGRT